jgi:signal transduction histidine kinase
MEAAMAHQRDPDGPLRIIRVRPGLSPEPADSPFAVERLTALTHDLAGLLDGSLRCLLLARRSLEAGPPVVELETARRQLDTVHSALERMSDLVQGAMSSAGGLSPTASHNRRRAVSLHDAVLHAAEVLIPEATQHGVRIETRIRERAAHLPGGPLYTVILNGIRNAMESIQRAQSEGSGAAARGGLIEIFADAGSLSAAGVVILRIEIRDDGRGLASLEEGRRALDFGYSTKPGSVGVGLALAREVVREVGGTIELLSREDRRGTARPGALLRINYPVVVPGA